MICENKYKRLTIRELINSLTAMMSEGNGINLDSEIIVSDVLMQQLNRELKLYTMFDYTDKKTKVGLFVNPNEDEDFKEEQAPTETSQGISEEVKKQIAEVQELTKQIENAPVQKNTDWFKKFA